MKVVTVRASAHFHHGHHAPELSRQFYIPLQDDDVGQERGTVRAETEIGIAIFQLGRHQHGDAKARQQRDHAVQRFAEVFSEGRRQRQLET